MNNLSSIYNIYFLCEKINLNKYFLYKFYIKNKERVRPTTGAKRLAYFCTLVYIKCTHFKKKFWKIFQKNMMHKNDLLNFFGLFFCHFLKNFIKYRYRKHFLYSNLSIIIIKLYYIY